MNTNNTKIKIIKSANRHRNIYNCILATGIAFYGGEVIADDEIFSPFAYISATQDDNVFLVSDNNLQNDPIDGQTDSEDTIAEFGAGFRSDITTSNQHFLFSANAFRRDYSQFSSLNFTGGNINAQWDWYLNRKWDGQIKYTFDRQQSNLANQRLINGDVSDLNQAQVKAVRHLNNNDEIYITALVNRKEYEERTELDSEEDQFSIGYKHITPKKNSLAFELKTAQGDNRNNLGILSIGANLTSYEQDSANLIAAWKMGTRNSINFEAGYISRSHDIALREFDHDGFIFDFRYLRKFGSKIDFTFGLGSKINNTENTQTLFTEEDFGFIETKWDISRRTQISANLRYREIDFTQINSNRSDEVKLIELKSRFLVTPLISLNFSAKFQDRDSNIAINQYDNLRGMISISYNLSSN